jgi:hypothetical protein
MPTKESMETNLNDTSTTEKYITLAETQEMALIVLTNQELDVLLNRLSTDIAKLNVDLHVKKIRNEMVKWEIHKRWTKS